MVVLLVSIVWNLAFRMKVWQRGHFFGHVIFRVIHSCEHIRHFSMRRRFAIRHDSTVMPNHIASGLF